jgi:hypothetical protein
MESLKSSLKRNKMKVMKAYFSILGIVWMCTTSMLNAYDLNVDPQREDTDLHEERIKGLQYTEDQNLQQEQTHDIQFEEDQNFKQERELGR